jgi:hypothetical protein
MRPRTLIHPLLLVILLSTLAAPAAAITGTPSWKPRELVYDRAEFTSLDGSDRMLAYDHHGNPGLIYQDQNDGSLDYARRVPGVGWASVEIDPNGGTQPSLAFDRYERPAIAYRNTTSLRFAHFNGTTWQLQTADTSDAYEPALAFDILGRAAIAYGSLAPNYTLKYIRDTDGDFSFADETPVVVDSTMFTGFFQSLAFDPLNRPMIAHVERPGFFEDVLKFSVEEPGIGWVTTIVDTNPSPFAVLPSVAIDPDSGYPAIAYGGGAAGLRFAAWNGDEWDLTTIDPTPDAGSQVSLAFDPADGHPAISYEDRDTMTLKFAWHNGSVWQTQTVETGILPIYQSSLAFNDFGNGFPSIAYVDEFSDLYFIEDPPLAVPEPAAVVLLLAGLATVCRLRTDTTG